MRDWRQHKQSEKGIYENKREPLWTQRKYPIKIWINKWEQDIQIRRPLLGYEVILCILRSNNNYGILVSNKFFMCKQGPLSPPTKKKKKQNSKLLKMPFNFYFTYRPPKVKMRLIFSNFVNILRIIQFKLKWNFARTYPRVSWIFPWGCSRGEAGSDIFRSSPTSETKALIRPKLNQTLSI